MAKHGEALTARECRHLAKMIAASNTATVARGLGLAFDTVAKAARGEKCNPSTIQLLRLRFVGAALAVGDDEVAS